MTKAEKWIPQARNEKTIPMNELHVKNFILCVCLTFRKKKIHNILSSSVLFHLIHLCFLKIFNFFFSSCMQHSKCIMYCIFVHETLHMILSIHLFHSSSQVHIFLRRCMYGECINLKCDTFFFLQKYSWNMKKMSKMINTFWQSTL